VNRKQTFKTLVGLLVLLLACSVGYAQGDNSPDPMVNLGCLDEAVLSGSVPEGVGRGIPSDILWNPATNDYHTPSNWHEYGLSYDSAAAGVTPENPFFWQVEWPTAKNINYITATGPYGNQPQPHTGWAIQYWGDDAWQNIAKADNGWPEDTLKGVGGWVNDGLLELKLMQPIVTTKLRIIAYANPDSLADDTTTFADSLWSFVIIGRQMSSSSPKACLIQYLDFSTEIARNRKDAGINLALLDEAVVSGLYDYKEIDNLRGHPMDMLWDPRTGDFFNNDSWWGEYGMPWQYDAGYLTHDNPFYWMVEWATPKNINYFTWGGCYGNQWQPFTPWAVEYWDGSAWVELASGAGTDRATGTWQYDSEGRKVDFWGIGVDSTTNAIWMSEEPIQTTKLRLAVWSDGIDPLFSFHIRGRGGRTRNWDERDYIRGYDPVGYVSNSAETEAGLGGVWVNGELGNADPIPSTFKALLVQYRDLTGLAVDQEDVKVVTQFKLYQNYPNPFNPTTTINFSLDRRQHVRLSVYNILGQEVKVLVNDEKPLGINTITFDASSLSSGVYFYKLQAGQKTLTKKMLLMR